VGVLRKRMIATFSFVLSKWYRNFAMDEIRISKIVRSRRRTVALVITPEAELIVRAPLRVPLFYIKGLVGKKEAWIRKKMSELSGRAKSRPKAFVADEEFLYLGRSYKLHIVADAATGVEIREQFLCLSAGVLPGAREAIIGWYKAEARRAIAERCELYAKIAGCAPSSVKITGARKRWGSCGPKGTLNFSWRLIMAPREVVDYVVVHELAHIGQLDHSPAYWSKVRGILPDYRVQEKWLKDNATLLDI